MTPDEYQKEVLRTAGTLALGDSLAMGAMGLAGEAGEFTDHIKKFLFHNHPLGTEKALDELGDTLWYVVFNAAVLGGSLEDLMARNVKKLRARYPDGFDPDRSKNRCVP